MHDYNGFNEAIKEEVQGIILSDSIITEVLL